MAIPRLERLKKFYLNAPGGVFLSCLLVLTGCGALLNDGGMASGGSGAIKARGVYTTLAMPGQHLDLPASAYLSYRTFAPGQTPAAVVVGYGENDTHVNYGQAYELRLVESASGTVLQTFNSQAYGDMADVVDLPIRKSGKYQLRFGGGYLGFYRASRSGRRCRLGPPAFGLCQGGFQRGPDGFPGHRCV